MQQYGERLTGQVTGVTSSHAKQKVQRWYSFKLPHKKVRQNLYHGQNDVSFVTLTRAMSIKRSYGAPREADDNLLRMDFAMEVNVLLIAARDLFGIVEYRRIQGYLVQTTVCI
ncbi:hypothetical protein VNO77_17271 [Canavalia gladiata]|uniref:Uncharacterized protein n=1 Tax=Canavalia gladiata TaxID=3824 RepID=A0AAN9QGG3_CANGL